MGFSFLMGALIGVIGFCGLLVAGDMTEPKGFEAGCKAASAANEVVTVNGSRRCVSAERAKELSK